MKMLKLWSAAIGLGALAFVACSGKGGPQAQTEVTGTLELALVGTDSEGQQYRLRNANFEIAGYPDYYETSNPNGEGGAGGASWNDYCYYDMISSEENLDEARIRRELVPGYYYVYFAGNDWYLEELTSDRPVVVDQAVLLSSRERSTRIYDDSTSRISYRFGVHGEVIDFRSGTLEIGIDIELPGEDNGAGGAPWEGTAGSGG